MKFPFCFAITIVRYRVTFLLQESAPKYSHHIEMLYNIEIGEIFVVSFAF